MFDSGNIKSKYYLFLVICVCFLLLFAVEKFQLVSNELPALRTSVSYSLSVAYTVYV